MPESFLPFFEWCGNTSIGLAVRDTVWAFPLIETFHLLALVVLLGTVLIINTCALGWGMRRFTVPQLAGELEPWMLVSLGVALSSGVLLFLSEPMKCYESYSFPVKMGLILIGITTHFALQRKWMRPGQGGFSPRKVKAAAVVSLIVWTGVGIAGKGIPYI